MNAAIKKTGLLFKQVYLDLLKRIENGEFLLDSQLPTEAELVKRYEVSITTIRKAVQQLADEGIVSKRQGMGTFVLKYPTALERTGGRNNKSYKIGVFLPNVMKLREEGDSRHWALNVRRLNGIYARATQNSSSVFVHGFGEPVDLKMFDGVISMPSYTFDMDAEDLRAKLMDELGRLNIPHVTISEFDPCFASKYWITELIEIEFYKAVNYLIRNGHRKIALIGPNMSWSNPRYTAYRKALERSGIIFDEKRVVNNPPSDSFSGKEACRELFMRYGKREDALAELDAIFCTTDLQAYGAISYLNESDIRIPEDISIMGVDNLSESEKLSTPLTTMEFSGPDIGAKALDLLIDTLSGKDPDGVTISCPGTIIERKSVMKRTVRSF